MTTARALAKFYTELIAEGLPADVAREAFLIFARAEAEATQGRFRVSTATGPRKK